MRARETDKLIARRLFGTEILSRFFIDMNIEWTCEKKNDRENNIDISRMLLASFFSRNGN